MVHEPKKVENHWTNLTERWKCKATSRKDAICNIRLPQQQQP